MAEAVRPKHRKQTKIKKVKPVTKSREISPINDPLSEIQADKEDILVISSDITEDSFKDTNLPDLLLERNTLKEDVIVKLKDDSSEVSSEIQSELGGLTSEHQAPSKTQPALKEDVIVKLKDESSEVSSDKQSEIGSLTSEHQAPSKTQPACLENENVNSKGIEKCVASEPHNLPQRPQNLPSLMLSSKQQFPELSTGSGASLQDISSSKNTFSEHQNGKPSIRTSMELPSPAVVEDPNTPMSRTVSPSTPKIVKEKTSPTVPAIILEEKSPNLLAQEAIARMKNLNIVSSSASEVTSSPVLQQTGSSSCHKSESIASQQAQFNLLSSRTQTMSPQHIYPIHQLEQSKEITKTPMSLTDLLSLYYNPELATNERFVEEFTQKEIKKENHEFYEIVSNYYRARRQLLSVEEDIKTLQKNYTALQKEVWITHVKSLSVQGTCADQARVYATHTYEQCELIADNLSKIGSTLENIRLQICDNLSLFAYTSQISKLQVESYIHNLYLSCPTFRDMAKNMPIPARHDAPFAEQHDIQRIKDCISVLFVFHRKPIFDTEFVTNIRQWTVRLISSLLRVASFSDHLFVLNHLLRCPSGVGKWSAELVQCPRFQGNPTQYQSNFSCPMLNHTITAMATVLLPVKAREEFMHQMQMNLNEQSGSDDRAWILVDSDGEEDEDPSNSWLYLHENDIVAFLRQFPLADIFSYILLSSITETGAVDYDIRRSTEPMMLRLFAFTTTLIQLLGTGLVTYSMARYRQLNKRLGRLIRQAISFVSDHWLNFKTYYGPLSPASMQNLQIEFDQLFMRATYSILKAQRLGSWQFMADMPYTCVSMDSMWQLLWVLHQGEGISVDMLPPVETCKTYLKNSDSWQQLADNLMHMPTSEAIYLLTTFANMAVCRSSEEEVFIHLITLEVFEIAYICNHTREFCNKVGRELLSSIILTHPTALSFLLTRVKEVMDKLGKMALYLFSELPVSIWQPTDPDILTLRQWLLNHELISNENQLAQIILAKINWDVFEETGKLVVDIRIHRQIALLLVEAYSKFISDKKAGFFILEGMKYMSSYLSYVTSNLSPEQKFNNWVWNVALRLKLHQHSVTLHSSGALDLNFNPPTLGGDTWLTPLHRATSSKIPIACFVTLTMTNIGHNITNFISEGLDLLGVLTANYQYTTAVHILGCVVPLFIDSQHYLLENSSFCQILQTLLGADESLLKSTKAAIMTVEFPGLVTQQLSQMIQAQVTSHLVHNKADLYILFWLKAIFKVCKYFTDRNSCYIADTLIRWSFVKKGVLDLITDIFKENYKKFCVAVKNRQGLVTSMFSWIANANTLPTFMEGASMPEFSWLAYMILSIEGEHEVNTSLWQTLIMELHAPNRPTVENALKAAVLRLQLDQSPSVARLTIYRWAHQALDTPPDHPLLPIMWQRFFALFLGRQVFESNISQRASVGERFFSNTFYNSLLKKMRKCLSDTSAFHLNYDPAADASKRKKSSHSSYTTPPSSPRTPVDCDVFDGTAASAPSQDESFEYTSSKEFHVMLARLYQMYKLWLEEPRLHDGNLYLPALPPQYESARLNQVFQGFMVTTERILRRLRRFDPPKDPPPVPTIQSAVPLINPTLVDDKTSFITMVQADQQVFIFFTKDFSDRHAHHCALDFNYLELLPNLYSNIKKTTTVLAECKSKVNPLHKCSNPAIIPISIEVKDLNEMVQRRLEENRAEYQQVLIQSFLPPAPNVCIAAVHTENAITMLIKQNQACTDEARLQNLNAIGCSIFYSMVNSVCDQTDFYPPARQFFASCIEVLGRVTNDILVIYFNSCHFFVQVKELLDWISSFFMHARINDTNCLTFGLYNRWGMYVPYISLMIGALSRCLVTKIIKSSKSLTPYQIMEFIWQPLVAVISPWLQPLLQADGTFALPWMEADDVLAVHLISSFYNTVLYIYQMMNSYEAGSGSGVMSLLVMYYMTALCTKTTKSHVIHLLVTESKILPWKELRPDLQLLEAMIRVKEVASPCCFAFIGYIIPQVQWQEIIDYSKSQLHPEVACRMQTGVAILLMQSYIDTEMAENEPISQLLLAGEKFDWSLINREGFSCVCQWFLQLCDPKCVLGEWSSRPALGLRLLKQMAGFHTNVQWTEVVSVKREIYLHCVSQQICHATYLAGIKIDAVCTVLINLLSEIEAIETSVPTVGHQEEESSKLLKEIFSLLNNSNPEGSWLESMLSELTGWLKSSPQSIMLVPSIKAASRSLASLRHMCTVLEAGVEAYFDGYDQSSEGLQGWPFVLTVYQVPELNQAGYVQDALSVNAFLVLFAYLQHKLPFCQKLSDELVIMEEILDWSSKCQAQAKDEAKIILWWHLLLRLIVRQLEFSISPITGTINIVSRFINYLNEIAQERTGKGLLGAIGLGQRSALSQSMRLVAKSLAIFLASQVISSEVIRTNPTSRPSSNVNVSDLRTLRKNKSYAHLSGTIDHILSFVQNADNTMKDVLPLFGQIVTDLYSDKRYLYEVMEVNTR
uniref:Ectopic P granules protein 5 homolog n=1 Tax=Biomphalaria glabrata TaxID=6526 RepID=A0A2C9JD30_BIOGL